MVTPPILMFHHVLDSSRSYAPKYMWISPSRFERFMLILHRKEFHCMSLSDLVDGWPHSTRQLHRAFVLTFDDAYLDVHRNALPLLWKLGFSATIFVIAQPVEQGNKRYLSWRDMRELERKNITFGSHTLTHPRLGSLNAKEVKHELLQSKQMIEDRLSVPVDLLAYPYGDSSVQIQEIARECGYRAACGVTLGHCSLFNLWRVPISEQDSNLALWLKSHGGYSVSTRLLQTPLGSKIRALRR